MKGLNQLVLIKHTRIIPIAQITKQQHYNIILEFACHILQTLNPPTSICY